MRVVKCLLVATVCVSAASGKTLKSLQKSKVHFDEEQNLGALVDAQLDAASLVATGSEVKAAAQAQTGVAAAAGATTASDGGDVECSDFDTYASCPGGWPAVEPDEAKHRVKCCGMASAGRCPMCNRCKPGSFADGCCACDDDELIDRFWKAFHEWHTSGGHDNSVISERELITLIGDVKGDMDKTEELKIKDVFENIMTHLVPDAKKSSSGLAYSAVFARVLKDNPDVVQHMLGETESPSEGQHQLALDHTKAITPQWFDGISGGFGDHLPPPVIRMARNGLWEAKVPNFEHPEHGYYPSVFKHTAAEARDYVNYKKAEALEEYAKKQEWQSQIWEKSAENNELATGGKYSERGDKK